MNASHRPRTLLSGLVFCGCSGGTYVRRGKDRFTCSNHMLGQGCDNAQTVSSKALETRGLAGLHNRLMTPEKMAEALRAYAQETNRLNRGRRNSAEPNRRELAETVKAIAEIVRVIEQGGWHRARPTAAKSPATSLSETQPNPICPLGKCLGVLLAQFAALQVGFGLVHRAELSEDLVRAGIYFMGSKPGG